MGVSPTIPPTNLSPATDPLSTQQSAGASPALNRLVQQIGQPWTRCLARASPTWSACSSHLARFGLLSPSRCLPNLGPHVQATWPLRTLVPPVGVTRSSHLPNLHTCQQGLSGSHLCGCLSQPAGVSPTDNTDERLLGNPSHQPRDFTKYHIV